MAVLATPLMSMRKRGGAEWGWDDVALTPLGCVCDNYRVILWMAQHVDMVLVFMDPHMKALCSRTMDVVSALDVRSVDKPSPHCGHSVPSLFAATSRTPSTATR